MKQVLQKCKALNTDSLILSLLVYGLMVGWYNGSLLPEDYPTICQDLIQDQTRIGWNQLMKGRFSVRWDILQDRLTAPALPWSGNWSNSVIQVLWDQWFLLWMLRNSHHHGQEAETRQTLRTAQVHKELELLYQKQSTMCCQDRTIFRSSVELHKAEKVHRIAAWIKVFTPFIRYSQAQLKKNTRSDIRKYFNQNPALPLDST